MVLSYSLDDLGGDLDVESNGDELGANGAEDDFIEFVSGPAFGHPGCAVGDPGEPDDEDCCAARDDEPVSGPDMDAQRVGPCGAGSDDDEEPAAWIEWETRGRQLLEYGGERLARDRSDNPERENDEDDDPAGDPLDDGELDEGVLGRPLYAVDQSAVPINEAVAHRAYLRKAAGI